MNLEIRQISNPETWDEFVKKQEYSPFLQSSMHGKLYKELGEKYWIFGIYEADKLIGGSLILSTHAKRGNFLFLPYGPVMDFHNKHAFKLIIDYISNFAKSQGYSFVRVSPFANDNNEINDLFKKNNFRKSPLHALAETTWMLELSPDEGEILSKMNKNHRNLIRRCEREEVKINI